MRRACGVGALLVAAALTACVPVTRRTLVTSDVIARSEATGDEVDVAWTGSVRAADSAFEVRVAGERQCRRLREEQVVRRTTVERSPDGAMLATSIVAGVILATLGGVFLYDHRDAPDGGEIQPLLYRADLDVGRGTGIALVAVGGVSLASAAIAGLRSRDEHHAIPTPTMRRVPVEGTVACGAAPALGTQITLGGEGTPTPIPVGTTGADGKLAIPYVTLPDALLVAPSMRVTATSNTRAFVVGDVSLEHARQMRLATAWRDVSTADDPERLEHHARLDPEHAAEALARARALRAQRITTKLSFSDDAAIVAATAELELLKRRHAPGPDVDALARQIEARRSELAAAQRIQRRDAALTALATTIAALQREPASSVADFQRARTQLEQAQGAADADSPRVRELAAALDTARSARVKALLIDSQRHLRASAFAPARQAARDAEQLAAPPDTARVQRALAAIDDRELAAIEREARKAIAAGRIEDALAAVERGLAIRDQAPAMKRVMMQLRQATVTAQRREAKARADADKAELDATLRRAEAALAAGRVDEATAAAERAAELAAQLRRTDPRLRRLMTKLRNRSGRR